MLPANLPVMPPAILTAMLLLAFAFTAAAADPRPWYGIDAASIVVVGNGGISFDENQVKNCIETELIKAGLPCIDIQQTSPGIPRVTIVAHIDGMPQRWGDGRPSGCIYHWSLSASCLADLATGGSGTIMIEEHHGLGYGPSDELPVNCINEFCQLASHMAMKWLRDNPY